VYAPGTRTATISGDVDSRAIAELYRDTEVPVAQVEKLKHITAKIEREDSERRGETEEIEDGEL